MHDEDEGRDHAHAHGGFFGDNTELIFSLACGVFLACGYLIEQVVAAAPGWVSLCFFGVAYFFGGYFTMREAIDNLRLGRFEIDTLMLVAAVGAATLGAFAEGALLFVPV